MNADSSPSSNLLQEPPTPSTPFHPADTFAMIIHLHAFPPTRPQLLSIRGAVLSIIEYSGASDSSPSDPPTLVLPLSSIISLDIQTHGNARYPYKLVIHTHSGQSIDQHYFFANNQGHCEELRGQLGFQTRAHWLLLLNPRGGSGSAKAVFDASKNIIMGAGIKLSWMETRWEQDAFSVIKNMSKEMFKQFDQIVCCSGDGIIHEVINGFFAREDRQELRLRIGALPAGSACSFVYYSLKERGLEFNLDNALYLLLRGEARPMELMKFTIQPFNRVGTFI